MSEVDVASTRVDGTGCYYGWATLGDRTARVDILPPAYLWEGDMKIPGYEPHPKMWTVYCNGELIARIERQEDVGASLVPLLAAGGR